MVEQGNTVFVISWVNPDERHADKDWQHYIDEGIAFGLDTVEQATASARSTRSATASAERCLPPRCPI